MRTLTDCCAEPEELASAFDEVKEAEVTLSGRQREQAKSLENQLEHLDC